MEIRIVETTSTNTDEIFTPSFGPEVLKARRPVWQALAELWLADTLTDFDFNYIAIRLADSKFKEADLERILHSEVCPAMQNPAMHPQLEAGKIDPRSLENLILLHLENQDLNSKKKESGWEKLKKNISELFKGKRKDNARNGPEASRAASFEEIAARWVEILDRIHEQRKENEATRLHATTSPHAIGFDMQAARQHAEDIL